MGRIVKNQAFDIDRQIVFFHFLFNPKHIYTLVFVPGCHNSISIVFSLGSGPCVDEKNPFSCLYRYSIFEIILGCLMHINQFPLIQHTWNAIRILLYLIVSDCATTLMQFE